ncbi:MAG: DNA polymerase, partial [bacterium]
PISQAKEDISAYFKRFNKLEAWLVSRKEFIEQNGFTYSFFGRKRRLQNVFSTDKGIAAHEVRSGINSEVQSLASDVNLLAAIETAEAVKQQKLDAKIFMLVHDSIVALVKDSDVEAYCELLRNTTQKDRGCGIANCPIGVDQDIGDDYSFGKFSEYYTVAGDKLAGMEAG